MVIGRDMPGMAQCVEFVAQEVQGFGEMLQRQSLISLRTWLIAVAT